MENRNAFLFVGLLFSLAGIVFIPLLCGIGFIFLIIGGIMWARD